MSRVAKGFYLAAFLGVVVAYGVQFFIGTWLNISSVALGVAGALVAAAIVWDWRLYAEFFTMRTTKHGMNMGALILSAVTLIVCVNYLANKHNKSWDLTQEKLNSLSDETTKVLSGLKNDVEIKVFYSGKQPRVDEAKAQLRQLLGQYKDASGKLKVSFINSYMEEAEASKYLLGEAESRRAPISAFVENGQRRIRVEEPFNEGALTSALIKSTRQGETKIYFLKGHGEKDIASNDTRGLRELVTQLEDASYKVEPLELMEKKGVPEDAAVVAIVGPTSAYLDPELTWLREYIQRGGHLLVAVDPGQHHNLANLVKPMGVEFSNNYVISPVQQVSNGGPATVPTTFDATSEITKSLSGAGYGVFPVASEVRPAPDKSADITVTEIVKADQTFTLSDITKPPPQKPALATASLGVVAKGKVAKAQTETKDAANGDKAGEDKGKSFEAVVFGDSDFMSNGALLAGLNRDLAMNAIAQLTNQTDLISIRPKVAAGNVVVLTRAQMFLLIIGGVGIPIILLLTSGVIWFRRRGA